MGINVVKAQMRPCPYWLYALDDSLLPILQKRKRLRWFSIPEALSRVMNLALRGLVISKIHSNLVAPLARELSGNSVPVSKAAVKSSV